MKNRQWEAIHAVFEKMEKLCGRLKSPPNPLYSEVSESEDALNTEADVTPREMEDLVKVRVDIRTQLDFLRAKLSENLRERDSYLVIFPIVAYFDEIIQTNFLAESRTGWPPLQKELFQIDDAGELFYETLDDIMLKPQTLPFIYEVYYFCLSSGFRGKYGNNPVKVTEYLKRLRDKIPSSASGRLPTAEPEDTGRIRLAGSPVWYYAASFALIGIYYYLLYSFAGHWS